MAQVNKRTTETKFVTLLADSRPDVDITFRDPILSRPTDHYLVGVDNFTLCSSGFSMIEPRVTRHHTALIRIVRKTSPMVDNFVGATAQVPAGTQTIQQQIFTSGFPYDQVVVALAGIESSEIITCVQQLLERLNRMAAIVNHSMNTNQVQEVTINAGVNLEGYTPAVAEDTEHLKFRISRDGKIIIEATNAFWACFAVEVPSLQNQYGFYGPDLGHVGPFYSQTGRRYLTVDVHGGLPSFGNMVTIRKKVHAGIDLPGAQAAEVAAQAALNADLGNPALTAALAAAQAATVVAQNQTNWNAVALTETVPHVLTTQVVHQGRGIISYLNSSPDEATYATYINGTDPAAVYKRTIFLGGNVLSALDRRVALELGTSLPVKNSPMVNHQKETPDFVLGRWMMKPEQLLITNDQGQLPTHGTAIGTTMEYQKASDRITYHELMPQQKLQVLRVRLYARIRKFNEIDETWSMRVIELPTTRTDWWHARIHFVSKD